MVDRLDASKYAAERHKKVKAVKVFRKVITAGRNDVWAMDLVDMGAKRVIKGFRYIFMCIDCFTRKAWAVPMVRKDSKESWNVFEIIMKRAGGKPNKIWIDQGGEFYSKYWKEKLEALDITPYSTYSEQKSVMVERLNRTIKTMMFERFTSQRTTDWVTMLPTLMTIYNTNPHSAMPKDELGIRYTPNYAYSLRGSDEKELMKYQYGDSVKKMNANVNNNPKDGYGHPIKLGDWVRISSKKGVFAKGYTATWSAAVYKVVRIDLNEPVLFHLEDAHSEEVKGTFYAKEIQKTSVRDINVVRENLSATDKGRKFYIDKIVSENVKGKKGKVGVTLEGQGDKVFYVDAKDVPFLRKK